MNREDLAAIGRKTRAFASYHSERAGYGGFSADFHARAETFLSSDVPALLAHANALEAQLDAAAHAEADVLARLVEAQRGIETQAAEIVALRVRATAKSCPCEIVEPCSKVCSCARPYMSGGCSRCCKYGSAEQQQAAAKRLAEQAATFRGLAAEAKTRHAANVELMRQRDDLYRQLAEYRAADRDNKSG